MQKLMFGLSLAFLVFSTKALSWEAYVKEILQHRDTVAVYLEPDPGSLSCEFGSPYLLVVDEQKQNEQKFSMILTALAANKKLRGFDDGCGTAIWGKSRPKIERISLTSD